MTNQELQSLKNKYDIIGNDPALNRALEVAVAVAPTDITVLVTGESGVGKENIPKVIHQNSPRKRGKYFAINCGAIPEGTIDSELFGHEKGSFTGANEMRRGYFEEADGGTLFLDEIGELPLPSQAKLLRVLQSGEFIRVGSSKVLKTDVRVIAATNINLLHAVSKGKFREDLYYRLNAVSIIMPALRERPGDINLLFRKFASDFSAKYGFSKVSLTEDASILLRKYRWPGNIRQLKNVAETISALESSRMTPGSDKCMVGVDVLSKYIPREEPNLLPATAPSYQETPESAAEREAIIRSIFQLKQDVEYLKDVIAKAGLARQNAAAIAPPEQQVPVRQEVAHEVYEYDEDPEDQELEEQKPEETSIKKASLELILKVLDKHGGNRADAAEELGISERTIYRKLKQIKMKK
ncbi:MAG: sigma-54-dependent Fis family transcriptional regulator [Bacteroidales bacterium]|nr:sigma-54-dependent Fis family transcriptional regulator [Bacteroidales bacterium]MBQ8049581.1 sigma-54-dependent Fis family transcriptional regulator [Bacteroidales bacterium]